jgi:bifunctional N-acetylglucosamine-1-phosphate-uridyltransferase/glucosamine-1-phosphate-acetyltransferase GlmU-like protein
MQNDTKIIILAAGKGTRMKSSLPKVLTRLHGKHMISHLLESVEKTNIDPKPIIVVGYEKNLVKEELGEKYEYVEQTEQLGTGHAVSVTRDACGNAKNIIVISGDQPFIKPETIKNLLVKHKASGAKITITTTSVPDFNDWREIFYMYGRIVRNNGHIYDKEFKDANEEEKKIKELNVSCYTFDSEWLWNNFKKIDQKSNNQKEFYLTDLWHIASLAGEKIESVNIEPTEALGANSKEELEILEKLT